MRPIGISDETMKRAASLGGSAALSLTFKEKLELAKLLDNLGVSVIEIEGIEKAKADALRIKSIASIVKDSALAVPVKVDGSDVDAVWAALSEAKRPRLQVQVAVSPSRMEYVHKMKAPQMLEAVASTVRACAAVAPEVEFIAEDATRTDSTYLHEMIRGAIDAGATIVTVCDDAGTMLPSEFVRFLEQLAQSVPQLADVTLGVSCSNELFMAVSTSIASIAYGAGEVKTTSYPLGVTELPKLAKALASKGDAYGVSSPINNTVLNRTVMQIDRICKQGSAKSALATGASFAANTDFTLTAVDDADAVTEAVRNLGYDLSEDDMVLVFEAFQRIASKKDSIGAKELDAIVASAALQVPSTYKLVRYTINSGSTVKATAYIQISASGEEKEGIGMGDGPVDAAFAAIDDLVGRSFELDDWQMQSVTEGQEAMGEAIIKLMSDGKMYSGRGISTDIIGSSIRAYLNAINKVVYEEGEGN